MARPYFREFLLWLFNFFFLKKGLHPQISERGKFFGGFSIFGLKMSQFLVFFSKTKTGFSKNKTDPFVLAFSKN